jgi:hypothetical protein
MRRRMRVGGWVAVAALMLAAPAAAGPTLEPVPLS